MADGLKLRDADRVLDMAMLSVASQWDGLDLNSENDAKLETMARSRVRQACENRFQTRVYRMDEWPIDRARILPQESRGPKLAE